jgi:GT2 family glycosyltransferase
LADLPKVSVILAYYKNQKDADECLASLLSTDYPDFEVILVDNASNDGAADLLHQKYPKVKIAQNTANLGSTGAWNKGYTLISKDAGYVAFIDSDLIFHPDWLTQLVTASESDPSLGGCMPKIMDYHDRESFNYNGSAGIWMDLYGYTINRGRVYYNIERDEGQYQTPCETFFIGGSVCFINVQVLKETGVFDESFFALAHEEFDISWRILLTGRRLACIPSSIVYHKGHVDSGKRFDAHSLFMKYRNNLFLLIKNYSLSNLVRYMPCRLALDVISMKEGGTAPVKAYYWILKNLRLVWSHRLAVQTKVRRVQDREYMEICIRQPTPIMHYLKGYKTWRDFLPSNPKMYKPLKTNQ